MLGHCGLCPTTEEAAVPTPRYTLWRRVFEGGKDANFCCTPTLCLAVCWEVYLCYLLTFSTLTAHNNDITFTHCIDEKAEASAKQLRQDQMP